MKIKGQVTINRAKSFFYVLSSEGIAILGGEEFQLKPGCFFRVPPETLHQFKTGKEPLEIPNFHSPPVFADHDTYFPEG